MINRGDKEEACEKPCVICKEDSVYRYFNYVDNQYLDDGCFCLNCNEWVEDPD